MSFTVGYRCTKNFFKVDAVGRSAERGKKRALSKIGSYVRTSARSSIRRRRAPSKPGQPPSSHVGTLRKFLFFAYEPNRDSVVVGPARTNQIFFDRDRRPVKGTVPQILEEGGAITLLEVFRFGRWQRADLRSRRRMAGLPQRYRTAHIQPRPYMRPALEVNRKSEKLEKAWKDVIK